jgi:NAD(P)-dependent dehydrogenase (short-subunit alcohol dehydrogenase family)
LKHLENKIALITGAGLGIGHEICKALSHSGATVVAVARDLENLNLLKQQLPNSNHQFWSIDLSREEGQMNLVNQLENFGYPHIVICNLHIPSEKKRLINTSKDAFKMSFTANVDHLFAIMEKTLTFQRNEKFGRWIGISSFAAQTGIPGQVIYNAQKSAMESVFRNLAVEEGKYGITSNLVAPGFIVTPATSKRIPKEIIEKVSNSNVIKRAGTAEEIAAAVNFLTSPLAGYITGITLPVCGGAQLAWNFT